MTPAEFTFRFINRGGPHTILPMNLPDEALFYLHHLSETSQNLEDNYELELFKSCVFKILEVTEKP